ncbi:hypothetical protein BIY24_03095 [Halobacteriovorax marinus]|nr:hypothetical protein [Halobacteriovorax marinus]ATH06956.1 hypothetical protein BIY24_03095 [Halobacteriovorax marinus]
MKSVLFSLSFVFMILASMVSCQSQRTRSIDSHQEIRNEAIFRNDFKLEREVTKLIENASQTKAIQFAGVDFN